MELEVIKRIVPDGPPHRDVRLELPDRERASGTACFIRRRGPSAHGTAGFDELRFYAEHFDTVEVNSTFYGQPRADVARTWVERTPAGFEFSLKLYQKFTHPKMFRDAALTKGAWL